VYVSAKNAIEGQSEVLTYPTPLPDLCKPKHRGTAKPRRIEILMNDRVTPLIQGSKLVSATSVPSIVRIDRSPEIDTEPSEICTDGPGLSIASVELPIPSEFG
jgi:hypothetical protein